MQASYRAACILAGIAYIVRVMPSPTELKAFLKASKISRQTAADVCEVSIHTVHGWCAPENNTSSRGIPGPAWKLLRLYATKEGRAAIESIDAGKTTG